jgi:hypothetical protein
MADGDCQAMTDLYMYAVSGCVWNNSGGHAASSVGRSAVGAMSWPQVWNVFMVAWVGAKRCGGERDASEVWDGVPAMRDGYGVRRTYRQSFNRGEQCCTGA